jgi:hypothetical protein
MGAPLAVACAVFAVLAAIARIANAQAGRAGMQRPSARQRGVIKLMAGETEPLAAEPGEGHGQLRQTSLAGRRTKHGR